MEALGLGVKSRAKSYTTATVTLDPSPAVTCAAACGNAGSLTHWVRPGIEPTSSQRQPWVLNPLSHNGNSLTNVLDLVFFFMACWSSLARDSTLTTAATLGHYSVIARSLTHCTIRELLDLLLKTISFLFNLKQTGVTWWLSRLRIWHCHCCGVG